MRQSYSWMMVPAMNADDVRHSYGNGNQDDQPSRFDSDDIDDILKSG